MAVIIKGGSYYFEELFICMLSDICDIVNRECFLCFIQVPILLTFKGVLVQFCGSFV